MKENIIGRKAEQHDLHRAYESTQSEFVAIYGRRRVGKTFLVREYFEQEMVFQCSGIANGSMAEQLVNFHTSLTRYSQQEMEQPKDWLTAFRLLTRYLETLPTGKKVVFLDELPWMDTPGSRFINALDHFWNGWASARHDILLIVCGSATSWMMDNLIHNTGGLYGRLTERMRITPFDLNETRLFLLSREVILSQYEVAECYMVFGGIPYYLRYIDNRLSLAQNIDRLLFNPNGKLYDEFRHLYAALFKNASFYEAVVKALSMRSRGMTRQEIVKKSGLKSGKTLSTVLDNLVSCGFVREYHDYKSKVRKSTYYLQDFFTLFYFHFLRKSSFIQMQTWTALQRTPEFYAWAGHSFELLSLLHIDQIKRRLGISGVLTNVFSWRSKETDGRAQIDLVIDRNDNTVNLCEMKFSENEFVIDKSYEQSLRNKVSSFVQQIHPRKSVQLTMVTTFGVKRNMYSSIMQSEVTLNDLFMPPTEAIW